MAVITEEMIACAEQLGKMTAAAGLKSLQVTVRVGDRQFPLVLEAEDASGNSYDYYKKAGHGND